MTLMTIANIRFDIDTSDKFYEEEHKYYDEQGPVFSNLVLAYQKKLYESPYRAYLEEKIGPVAFKNMELAQKSMSEALIPLMQEENSLTMEYDKLIAGAKIDFDGRELNLSLLRPYLVNSDRNVRRQAWEKMSAFFLENEEQLDTIYDKLVKNRHGLRELPGAGILPHEPQLLRQGRGRSFPQADQGVFRTLRRETA